MIQRIQSVFLLLAAVAAFLLFYFPIWSASIEFFIYEADLVSFSVWDSYSLRVLAVVIGSISFLNIFLFKIRYIQMLVGWLNISLSFAFLGMVYYISNQLNMPVTMQMISLHLHFGTYIPIIIMLFTLLSNYFIAKDEKLIRSMDRLR